VGVVVTSFGRQLCFVDSNAVLRLKFMIVGFLDQRIVCEMECAGNCRVLSVQSHVVSGYVGNKSATFPLQVRLSHVQNFGTRPNLTPYNG